MVEAGRRLLAEPGIGSFPLVLPALLCKVYLVLRDEARADGALGERGDLHVSGCGKRLEINK